MSKHYLLLWKALAFLVSLALPQLSDHCSYAFRRQQAHTRISCVFLHHKVHTEHNVFALFRSCLHSLAFDVPVTGRLREMVARRLRDGDENSKVVSNLHF